MDKKRGGLLTKAIVTAISLVLLFSMFASLSAAPANVKIGVILPFTGAGASVGKYAMDAVEFIVDRYNAAGGIKSMGGAQVEIVKGDSRSTPDVGMSEAERLILKEKVVALMGAYQSGVTLTATTVSEKYKIPFVVILSTSDQITERGFKYVFRPHGTASMDQKSEIDFLLDMGEMTGKKVQTIAIVSDNSEGAQLPASFLRKFIKDAVDSKKASFSIVFDESYPLGMTDFTPMIIKLKQAKPDVILLVAPATSDGILFSKSMLAQRYAPNIGVLSFGGATLDPSFVPSSGQASQGWFTIQGWSKDLLKSQPAWAQEMFDSFLAKYKMELTGDVCKVFLDTYTLLYGLEKAGSSDSDKLRAALSSLVITEGPALMVATTAKVTFDEKGQNPNYRTGVAQINDGKYVLIWPKDVALKGFEPGWPAKAPWLK